jgi:glycosyltransferase involved in cell wall biosynthesis
MIPEDLTILLTNINSLEWMKGTISSFLRWYPDFKKSFLVFDTYSTDGSIEWLEKNEVKWCSWRSKKYYDFLLDRGKKFVGDLAKNRLVPYAINEGLSKVQTKYVLIIDSDIIFLKGSFLEKFQKNLDNKEVITSIVYDRVPYRIGSIQLLRISFG